MIELTTTEVVTFSGAVVGAVLMWTVSIWAARKPRIKSPSFFWSCGCSRAPKIADKRLVVRK